MTSLKKEERKRKKNWKGQLQNCGHHLERVLSVLLNQLPRIGCPFNARTCPFSFLSLSPSVEGRKKGFGIKRTRKATPKQPVIRSGICLACACVRACVGPRERRHPDTPQTGGTTRLRLNYSIISAEGSVGNRDPRGDATTRTLHYLPGIVSRLTRNRDFHEGGKKKEESNGKWKYCSVSSDPDPQRGPFSLRKVEFERLIYTVFQDPLDDLCPITRNEINNCTILREKGRIINKNSRRSFILDDC